MKQTVYLIYGVLIGVLGVMYAQAHKPEQIYRVTCDAKKYGFQWMTESQMKHESYTGVHCFMGAEMVKVDRIGGGLQHELFDEESRYEFLPILESEETKR